MKSAINLSRTDRVNRVRSAKVAEAFLSAASATVRRSSPAMYRHAVGGAGEIDAILATVESKIALHELSNTDVRSISCSVRPGA